MSLNNQTIATDSLTLSQLYTLQSILFEIGKNIALINNGASGEIVSVNGANLFRLAAQYYGDATLWTSIANANNLIDPVIVAGTALNLVIPSKPVDNGGVLQL